VADRFILHSPFQPAGDQPEAIAKLLGGLSNGHRDQTLLGVTGSGKTFTMANVVAKVQKPTLVISPNKTLAAQLASEFREFFSENAVDYFVSYYDYYQPEAYVPTTDTYIEKETEINEEIDRLRAAATRDILTRKDVLVVASVSCIYGIGSPAEYRDVAVELSAGQRYPRQTLLRKLNAILYQRNDVDFYRGTYRVRGDILDLFPSYDEKALRFQFDGETLESLAVLDPLTGKVERSVEKTFVFPARQFVTREEKLPQITSNIREELRVRLEQLRKAGKLLEAERLEQRTTFDLEMMETAGYCKGVENYSRFFDFRKPGEPPSTLIDYFRYATNGTGGFLLFVDESHIALPQIRGMYAGDRSRKQTLVDYGFRLPSAVDNRPLTEPEFRAKTGQTVYVSATPAETERRRSRQTVEQIIRPTGLLDPEVEIRKTAGQVDDLVAEIKKRVAKKQRVLVTTLTKRIAEDLADYLADLGTKVQYLHSDVETFDRLAVLRSLRLGEVDVVVGINLLREGLDLPEVSLVAILDADKEGYLRSETALIQTMGRAARHVEGRVIMYADRVTESMRRAMAETDRRRRTQLAYNRTHGITPKTIEKAVREDELAGKKREVEQVPKIEIQAVPKEEVPFLTADLTRQMELAAQNLEFERAAALRDQLEALKKEARLSKLRTKLRGTARAKPLRPFARRR
jgi:excinuclease ABC subunit B